MSKPLKKYFPSIAIGPVGLAEAAGVAWKPGAQFSCPQCTRREEGGETLTAVRDDNGGWLLTPCRRTTCGWSGSLFDHYTDSSGLSPQAAIRELKRRGVKISRHTSSPKVLAAWMRDRDARRALNTLAWKMGNQNLPGPFHAHQLASYGLTDNPHNHPLWWTTTPADLDQLTGRAAKPASVAFRRLGVTAMEEMGHPTVAIPLWESEGVISGFYAVHPSEAHGFARQKPGSTGLGFLHTKDWRHSTWGDYGVITNNVRFALVTIAVGIRSGWKVPIVYVPGGSDPKVAAKKLAGRSWVYYLEGPVDGEESIRVYTLARLLNARVTNSLGEACRSHISNTLEWWVMLARHLERVIISAQRPEVAADIVRQVGGGGATLIKIQSEMAVSVFEKLRTHLAPQASSIRTVEAAPGVTITETVDGWVWDETGEIVLKAYPSEVRGYRAKEGTRHRGVVVCAGKTYPFDTARLRKDPGAVIESTLLRHGVMDAPPPHPRVLPYVAATAIYFSQPQRR